MTERVFGRWSLVVGGWALVFEVVWGLVFGDGRIASGVEEDVIRKS